MYSETSVSSSSSAAAASVSVASAVLSAASTPTGDKTIAILNTIAAYLRFIETHILSNIKHLSGIFMRHIGNLFPSPLKRLLI